MEGPPQRGAGIWRDWLDPCGSEDHYKVLQFTSSLPFLQIPLRTITIPLQSAALCPLPRHERLCGRLLDRAIDDFNVVFDQIRNVSTGMFQP